MIETTPESAQAGFDVAQALAIGQLRESHREKLVPARKAADLAVALITIHAAPKLLRGNEIHQLREDRFALMHAVHPPEIPAKDGQNGLWNSNRKRFVVTSSP